MEDRLILEQIQTAEEWLFIAAVAYRRGNVPLSRQALTESWQYQRVVADQTGKDLPKQPEPDELFKDWTEQRYSQAEAKIADKVGLGVPPHKPGLLEMVFGWEALSRMRRFIRSLFRRRS